MYNSPEAETKFSASLGTNCMWLPFTYGHFEDDVNPRVLKQECVKHLDRRGQNPDWHSDSLSKPAAFWNHKDHQDRTVWLQEQIAVRSTGKSSMSFATLSTFDYRHFMIALRTQFEMLTQTIFIRKASFIQCANLEWRESLAQFIPIHA
ncbi:hypothetical protein AJ80_06833 [Polytolypa hystricis UAMH7299]|uniref:Uncharacterized protein n=1 Tax=Polytolypa hystricis (strain UAMH7299) TaxID=1447883 RepID=A0A2B7XTZ5_POLH7|nr:hypothetical protein AJ80_06833 [Polytolypa hystricis UAMH7299]